MTQRVDRHGLQVAAELAQFIEEKALPDTGVTSDVFWSGFSALVHDLAPTNGALLAKREDIQQQIDGWHIRNRGQEIDPAAYRDFLTEIGYLVPEGPDFAIETAGVDPEIASVAGPQLVVPIMNARFALNAANARWGSLYDAFYGTDALGDLPAGKGYDADRGGRVIARAKDHLDTVVPLADGSWADVAEIAVADGVLTPALADPTQFAGYADGQVLLRVNGLHIQIIIDPTTPIGASDPAGISDIRLESALSTIMDCEDSVAAVDAEDKVLAYSNWLGLMKGDLEETFEKGGKTITRRMNPDLTFTAPDGAPLVLKGRSLMLVRNVGHLMTNPAILLRDGAEIPEGLMDAMVTTLIAMHDLQKDGGNSLHGSVYVVKPKMHGPRRGRLCG